MTNTATYTEARSRVIKSVDTFLAAMKLPAVASDKELIAMEKINPDRLALFNLICARYGLPSRILSLMKSEEAADILTTASRMYLQGMALELAGEDRYRSVQAVPDGIPMLHGARVQVYSWTKCRTFAFVRVADPDCPHDNHVAMLEKPELAVIKKRRRISLA